MVFTPVTEAGPARRMAVAGAAIELAAMHKVENDHGSSASQTTSGWRGPVARHCSTLAIADRSCLRAGAHPGRRLIARLTEFFEDLSDKP
jgi:hypothetical protein